MGRSTAQSPNVEDEGIKSTDSFLLDLYQELRSLAQHRLGNFPTEKSLGATELVHEVFLKLTTKPQQDWETRKHFIDVASLAMRSVLVDRARARMREKRGAGVRPRPLPDEVVWVGPTDAQTIFVDEYIDELRSQDERAARVVNLRFFQGMSDSQIAELLSVSKRTVRRDWLFARTWLHGRMVCSNDEVN